MSWNDERVETLKKLWSDGLSASQIAGRLGGVTRNAVIGKVHRLGLSGRATTSRMAERIGFDVLLARDGLEALELFHREGPKITGVLLDLTMPILDGNATFTELRRLDPDSRRQP